MLNVIEATDKAHCSGAWRFEVFSIDDFEDRQMMYAKIMPALYGSQFQRVLWVGVHPYT